MKKRLIALLVCTLAVCSLLTGCMKNAEGTAFAGEIKLGEDGIVKKEVFESLISRGEIASICGKSGNIDYKWTVSSADITQPRDLCMAVSVEVNDDGAAVKLLTDASFGFLPTLAITLDDKWDASGAGVYDEKGNRLSDASLTGSERTTVSFKLTDGVFAYLIRADKSEPAPTENANLSDGSRTERDEYKTDPVPAGKPEPVEPTEKPNDTAKKSTCTISIECSTILNNLADLKPEKLDVLPSDGVILGRIQVEIYDGESVFDVLGRVCRENGIQLEASWTPGYNSAYVEGINNIYEKDCGELSGWTYMVNGWQPNYGCSRYALHDGDVVQWRYTCDLGADVGGGMVR